MYYCVFVFGNSIYLIFFKIKFLFNLSFLEKIHSRHGCQQYHKIILQSWNHGVEKSKKDIFPQRSFTISAHLACRQTCKIVEETIASLVLE